MWKFFQAYVAIMWLNIVAVVIMWYVLKIDVDRPSGMVNYTVYYPNIVPLFVLQVALIEEALLRLIPLGFSLKFWGINWKTAGMTILSSAVFGYLHGGIEYIPIQGVAGLVYCVLFLKVSGWESKKRSILKAYLSVVCLHAMFDGIAITIAILIGVW